VTDGGPYALALAAGTVAALNPCGFAMLPAYLTMLISGEADRASALRRATVMTLSMTAGFVAVFGAFGLVAVPLALSLERYLPWATVVIGIALVLAGAWLLAGRHVSLRLPRLRGGAPDRSALGMVGYGVAYATASLSCTIGPFLAILTSTTRTSGTLPGILVLVTYGLGMALVVGVLAFAVALARDAVVARVRRVLPYVDRLSGALLVVAGLYVAWYGWYEIRVFSGATTSDPVVDNALGVQSWLARTVDGLGPLLLLGGLGVLAAALVLIRRRGRRLTRS